MAKFTFLGQFGDSPMRCAPTTLPRPVLFVPGCCPICVSVSASNFTVAAEGGVQGISVFVMYSYFCEQMIHVFEQLARLADVHVSWVNELDALQMCIWFKNDLS